MRIVNLLTLIFLIGSSVFGRDKIKQPNIIVVFVDDMGIGDASFTNGEVRPTPNIDRMAAEGKIFTQFYSNSPVCSPSRVAITTGMYPLRWNINTFLSSKGHNQLCDQSDYLLSKAPSVAKVLKESGYTTAHFGKWHMGGGRNIKAPLISEYGFDEYASTWESPDPDSLLTSTNWIWAPTDSIKRWDRTAYFVDKTLDFLKRNMDKPCYINLWPDDVHSPWVDSEQAQQEDKKEYYTLDNLEPVIDDFDKQIGRLLDGLKEIGVDENTLIIFTSDNGPAPTFDRKRTNGMRGCKNSLFEGGINMPCVIHWPSVIKPKQVDSLSILSSVDLFPTLVNIAGGKLPGVHNFDGEDVSKSFLDTIVHRRKGDVFWEYGRVNPKYSIPKQKENISLPLMVRHGKWKCFTDFEGNTVELYNLETDPNENNNQAEQFSELAQELKTKLLMWFEEFDKSELSNN